MGVAADLLERGRAGEPAGACLSTVEESELTLAVLLRPGVPMSHLMGVRSVCALGALDCLRSHVESAVLSWPGDVVVPDAEGHAATTIARLGVHAATGEAGMFVVCETSVALPSLPAGTNPDDLARELATSISARVDAWSQDVAAGRGAAGPLAPVLSEFFDDLALMGHEASVVYPNGRVAARGTFTAVDVWGRATVRLADGRELVISPEQASLR